MTDSLSRQTLEEALTALKDRQAAYGSPVPNFERIRDLWNAYKKGSSFTTVDVAILMALVKVARLMETPSHPDSWVDLAGYAACGREVSAAKSVEKTYESKASRGVTDYRI